ncbi:HD-GYP domain-containing protein [Chitinimonas koreensis]|uniref:HD-GYP domain-containing protein n=1 Tax=Chitinimonas koreensis TaxID=356302 RepID=UPI000420FFB4|nr:HD-GYP domain-containing protein [Chitinimonas koreensis]QNM96880.1 HD-GYP domain-containing protein [Chitinimonas koreensis]
MIKRVASNELKVGMYIHDLGADWSVHPFMRSAFLLRDDRDIETIVSCGIHEVYIDTDRGLDVPDAPTQDEVQRELEREMIAIAAAGPAASIRVSTAEEMGRARAIKSQAANLVRNVMADVRLGRAVAMEAVEPMVTGITESILRNSGALIGLMHIKNKDDYTFLHSVSVCTFMVAFCRSVGLDAETTRQAGLGGLLHDTGKALVPDAILNKPGRLTDEEFEIIRRHPSDGHAILLKTPGVGEIPLDITLHHHERVDGSGYPHKLAGDQISTLTRMAAIVDVYDAITADRCYHKGMPATDALRKIFEWSKHHFDPALVKAFMRCIGIYPVGTLVLLESQRLGVVTEHNEDSLLQPRVKVFFDVRRGYLPPFELDLAKPMGKGGADRIVSHESPAKWKVDPQRFM